MVKYKRLRTLRTADNSWLHELVYGTSGLRWALTAESPPRTPTKNKLMWKIFDHYFAQLMEQYKITAMNGMLNIFKTSNDYITSSYLNFTSIYTQHCRIVLLPQQSSNLTQETTQSRERHSNQEWRNKIMSGSNW